MQYLIAGLIFCLVFFLCLIAAFYIGFRMGNKIKPTPTPIDPEMVRKQKEFEQGFIEMMNYDTSKALERKKVI